MMISIPQLRAARALLNWKQKDIADASGLSLTTLNYIEQESVSPRGNTMAAIQKAFEHAGIEFLSGDGVRMKAEVFNVQTFEGPSSIRNLLDDVITAQKQHGQGALWFGVSEDVLIRNYRQEYFAYFLKFRELNLIERAIAPDRHRNFYGPSALTEYRTLPHDLLGEIDYAIYGNKLCFASLGKRPRLIAIEHEGIVSGFRAQFEAFWKLAKPVPPYLSGFEKDFIKYGKK